MKIYGPRMRITRRGVRVSGPRARIGDKVGLNVSKRGVSASVRTKYGTLNTKRGVSLRRLPGCLMPLLAGVAIVPLCVVLACGGNEGGETLSPTATPSTYVTLDGLDPATGDIIREIRLWSDYQTRSSVAGTGRHGDLVKLIRRDGGGVLIELDSGPAFKYNGAQRKGREPMQDQDLLARIVVNPQVLAGKPVIRGTRLACESKGTTFFLSWSKRAVGADSIGRPGPRGAPRRADRLCEGLAAELHLTAREKPGLSVAKTRFLMPLPRKN